MRRRWGCFERWPFKRGAQTRNGLKQNQVAETQKNMAKKHGKKIEQKNRAGLF